MYMEPLLAFIDKTYVKDRGKNPNYAINYGSLGGSKIVFYKSQNIYNEIIGAHNNGNYLPAD